VTRIKLSEMIFSYISHAQSIM